MNGQLKGFVPLTIVKADGFGGNDYVAGSIHVGDIAGVEDAEVGRNPRGSRLWLVSRPSIRVTQRRERVLELMAAAQRELVASLELKPAEGVGNAQS